MKTAMFCALLVLMVCVLQGTTQAQDQCQRTNPKPKRYCLDQECKKNSDCGYNKRCKCDGDCGLSCIPNDLKCDGEVLRKPKAAVITVNGRGFQQTVTYSCKNGLTLRGSKKRVCRGIGRWDGKKTRCSRLCKNPGDIQFGNKNSDKNYYKVGSTVNYWCFPNYNREGSSRIKCTKAGTWDTSPPKCKLPTCTKPDLPVNANSRKRLKAKYQFNEIIVYACDHGYFTAGSRVQRCQVGGKWSALRLRCIPKSCGDPRTPKNGKRRGYVFTFKKKVYYECDVGYEIIGPEFRQCQSNQKWSDDTPTCEPVDCGRLATPKYGQKIEETKTTYLGRVTFQCNKKGYELKGSKRRVCRSNGRWDGALTKCEPVECKDPGTPEKGGRNPDLDKYVFENQIQYSCKKNHTIKGDRLLICQDTKTWTGSMPKCLSPCPDPGIPKGGSRHRHSFIHGDKVTFSCKKGWKMEGEKNIACNDGRWNYKTPTCLEGCTKPRHSPNGYVYPRKDFYYDDETVQMHCKSNYVRVGDSSARCNNGKWNNNPPSCKRKCYYPGSPYNGWKVGNEFFQGKQVSFRCNHNYNLIGLSTIQCLDTGRWSGSVPECKRRCGYSRPSNSKPSSETVLGPSLKHGTTIDHSCTNGYTLVGQKTISCDDGQWSPSIPKCKAPCSDPGPITYGNRFGKTFLHRSIVNYACNNGYTLDGPGQLICYDGQWSKSVPSCKKSCGDPGNPQNGRIIGTNFKHGSQVSYRCNRGTERVGSSSATCTNGKWSSQPPKCLEICSNLKRLANGNIIGLRFQHLSGDKVTFSCNAHYDLFGNKEIFCDRGIWNGTVPQCVGRCGYSQPLNSKPSTNTALGPSLKHGTTIDHSCVYHYTLVGQKTISCNDGRWSSSIPKCKAPCSDPGPISNGNRFGKTFLHRSIVKYGCNNGYTLDGPRQLICDDGRWSKPVPSCKKSCDDPGTPQNGRIIANNFKHGSQVSYRCNRGTERVGSSSATCTNGKWSSQPPKCLEICRNLQRPLNGNIKGLNKKLLSGDKLTFSCNAHYDLVGNKEVLCDRGIWNGAVPQCVGQCKVPNHIDNLQSFINIRSGDWLMNGTNIKFFCNMGHTLEGRNEVICQNGAWNHGFPKCKVPCPKPALLKDGTQNGSQFRYEFKCNAGYSMEGPSVINCIKGAWSPNPPQCFRNCEGVGNIRNAVINKNNNMQDVQRIIGVIYKHGDRISIWCREGFRINGNPVLMCNDGIWSDNKPTCIGVCPSLNPPQHGERLGLNFAYGSTVRFRCHYGYTLRGKRSVTCNHGTWSHKAPVCRANCRDPGTPDNGQRNGSLFSHLQTVRFSCDKEFIMDGTSSIQCLDGSWTSNKPACIECGSPLGMKNRKIPDRNIWASTRWSWSYDADYGRLNGGSAWCSSLTDARPYLGIDLGKPYKITYIATQGSHRSRYWVSKYVVSHSLARSNFIEYRESSREKLFTGNEDNNSIVKHKLENPFIARKIKFHPVAKVGVFNSPCMRVEVYGCDLPNDCVMVGSRVFASWVNNYHGGDIYNKAIVQTIGSYNVQLEIEDEKHHDESFKRKPKTSIVLDVPNKQLNLPSGTRVLMPYNNKYYTGNITSGLHEAFYQVDPDNSIIRKTWIKKNEIRVLKPEQFCE